MNFLSKTIISGVIAAIALTTTNITFESGYIKAISDACQAKEIVKAELNAKALGRFWNVDYRTLIRPSCG